MKKRTAFQLSIMAFGVATALTAQAAATPFAPLPLHLTSNISSKAKPNVLLLLDNSGSMLGIPEKDTVLASEADAKWFCEVSYKSQLQASSARFTKGATYNTCEVQVMRNGRLSTISLTPTLFRYCGDNLDGKRFSFGGSTTQTHENLSKYNSCAKNSPATPAKSRMDILKSAMDGILSNPKNQNLRWGVSYLNKTTINDVQDVAIGDNTWESVKNSINKVKPYGGTPVSSRYAEEANKTFVDGNAIQYRCQKNFMIVLSDGEANGINTPSAYDWYIKNWKGNNQIDNSVWDNTPTLRSDNSSQGWQYRSLITGTNQINEPNRNNNYGLWAMTHILSKKDLRETGRDNEGGDWQDKDHNEGKQTVATSTIAFGLDTAYMRNGAQGDNAAYYSAKNAEELNAAFEKLVNNAVTAGVGYSTTAPSISGSTTNLGTISLSLDLAKGFGTFKFVDLKRNTTTGQLQATEDSSKSINYGIMTINPSSDRVVLMSNANKAPKVLAKDDIDWLGVSDSSVPNKQSLFDWLIRNSTKADSALPGTRQRAETAIDPKRMMGDVINSGVIQAGATKAGTKNTIRFTPYLATAANDGMVHILKRNDNNETQPYSLKLNWIPGAAAREAGSTEPTVWDAVQNTTAKDYLTGSANNRQHTYLLNGGLAYRNTYNGHIFAVGALGQGGKGAYAFNIGGVEHADKTKATGIDTPQNDWVKTVPLWETANSKFAGSIDSTTYSESQRLGYTVGTPVIDRIALQRNGGKPVFTDSNNPIRYAAAIANGYFSTDNTPALYLYDALGVGMTYQVDAKNKPTQRGPVLKDSTPGKLIAKLPIPTDSDNTSPVPVTTDNGLTEMNNGLSSPALIDMDKDGVIDVAYAGDLRGNMYRFDLRGATPSAWTVQRIFKGSPENPITAAPAIYRESPTKTIVTFGTGRDLFNQDLKVKSEQYFYAVYDDLEKSWASSCSGETCQAEVTVENRATQLLEQKITETTATWNGTSQPVRTLPIFDAKATDMSTKQGWFMSLKLGETQTGERVVTQPQVVGNGVFFTTRVYTQESSGGTGAVCTKENSTGYSWVMGADVKTGGSPSKDSTNFGTITVDGKTVYLAAYKLNGISSQPVFAPTSVTDDGTDGGENDDKAAKCHIETAHNDQGQAQDGIDCDLTNPLDKERDFCARPSANNNENGTPGENEAVTNKSPGDLIYNESTGGFGSAQLYNKICPVELSLRRLSWREIF